MQENERDLTEQELAARAVADCPAVGYQQVDVCVPVAVTPYAQVSEPITRCCGAPIVTPGNDHCPGEINGQCNFTISQTICIEVLVEFGASAIVGDTYVDCQGATATNVSSICIGGA